MKLYLKILAASTVILPLGSTQSQAVTLAAADFDSGYSLGSLNGQSGSGDIGLSGTWAVPAGFESDIQVISGGLDYQVAGGGLIEGGSHALRYTRASGDGSENNLTSRNLASNVADNEVYVRFVIQQVAEGAAGDFLFFWHTTNGDTGSHSDSPGIGVYNDLPGGRIDLGATATAGSFDGTPQLLVAKFTKDGVSNDYETVDFWINPAFSDSGTPDATITETGQSLEIMQFIGLQVANMTGSSDYLLDSYAMGNAWTDVVPIPEPSSYALFAGMLALAGMVLWRQRH